MATVFSINCFKSAGGTFLDWSIHWLSGQQQFFNTELGVIPLSRDPITAINAHGHLRNHISGLEAVASAFDLFDTVTEPVVSIYPFCSYYDVVANQLNIPATYDSIELLTEYRKQETGSIWNLCHQRKAKIICLDVDHSAVPLYFQFTRNLDRRLFSNEPLESTKQVTQEYLDTFYKQDAGQWDEIDSVWNYREYAALNTRPFDDFDKGLGHYVDYSIPHLRIDARELWYDGENVVRRAMTYIGLDIDESRLDHWKTVYSKWQAIQLDILKFTWNLDYICKAIIENRYFDLVPFKLDLYREIIILHVLLYRYNMNLKSWQLTQFPTNTQQLHALLEPNIHGVTQ
jgi:hypothetical protein